MKKTMILAAFAALISLASCQKEEVINNNGTDKKASPVFTASIAGATKTTINLTNGKVAWEEADEITVTDNAKNSAVYMIESIDATTSKATFVLKANETALGDGPYTATYGAEPATVQFYSETAGKLFMTAPETSSNSFTFTVKCGLMKLNLTSPDESVKSIAVTGTPTGGSETTYTLTCDPAQRMDGKDFFIALPAGTYTKIEITNANDKTCTLNSTNGVEVAANHIKPVTFGDDKVKFEKDNPVSDGKLPGKFTINEYDAQVYFSQGNLYYDGVDFRFEEHQYDFKDDWDDCHISHFYWSSSSDVATDEDYDGSGASDVEPFFTNEDETTANPDFTVYVGEDDDEGQTGVWRTLSTEEWQYLFDSRTASTVSETDNARYARATVNSTEGIILLPDNYTHPSGVAALTAINTEHEAFTANTYNVTDWGKMESAGAVFLPAAGSREDSNVDGVGSEGNYWSSTAYESDSGFAYNMFFDTSYYVDSGSAYRGSGYSVRLVTNVE